MPIMVQFQRDGVRADEVVQDFGPYRGVMVHRDELFAFEGLQAVRLAVRTSGGGWEVNGLEGLVFTSFTVYPPTAEAINEVMAAVPPDYHDEE